MVNRIAAIANERCDALDGVADGLVSNMIACRALSSRLLEELACKNGETGYPDTCLTPAQIAKTIDVYHNGYALPFSFVNGINVYPGYNSLEGITMQIGSQPGYITPTPPSGPNAHHVNRADQFMKFFVTRDPNFDLRTFDIQNPGAWQDRLVALSDVLGATDPNFEAFRARGGKIIWLQGWDDPSVTPFANINVNKTIAATMGKQTDSFLRLYLVPGLAHGGGNFSPVWDNLTALDNWVEKGVPPTNPVVFDGTNTSTRGRSRPLCEYPAWPKYNGSGDANLASSFTCAAPTVVTRDETDTSNKANSRPLCVNPGWAKYNASRDVNTRPDFATRSENAAFSERNP